MIRNRYYSFAPPLTFDEAVYWTDDAAYSEWMISLWELEDAKADVRAYVTERLRITVKREIAKNRPTWARYTTVPSARIGNDQALVMRHTCYEQPGFREIKLFRAPARLTTLRILPEGGTVTDLPLRRLMYRGDPARGALHDSILYIVLPG